VLVAKISSAIRLPGSGLLTGAVSVYSTSGVVLPAFLPIAGPGCAVSRRHAVGIAMSMNAADTS
jgi:hypothetical protein